MHLDPFMDFWETIGSDPSLMVGGECTHREDDVNDSTRRNRQTNSGPAIAIGCWSGSNRLPSVGEVKVPGRVALTRQ